ncbi:MAG: hypothetical protein KJ882_06500 [Proteobacteria bacterium]|nr:hypothetical protein [Pseudomonadota bacterium]MBU4010400.1 hypothetical protein [Pseudomonadota bacterium]
MKIIDGEVIRNGEQDLIDSINGDLDWGNVEEIFKQQHHMKIGDDVEYKHGDIVVYNDQVAYRLEFDVKVNFTVILDREGNCLSVKTPECDEISGENGNEQNNEPQNSFVCKDNEYEDNDIAIIKESSDQTINQETDSIQERIAQAVSNVAGAIIHN